MLCLCDNFGDCRMFCVQDPFWRSLDEFGCNNFLVDTSFSSSQLFGCDKFSIATRVLYFS